MTLTDYVQESLPAQLLAWSGNACNSERAWSGVVCNGGSVIALHLSNMNLSGKSVCTANCRDTAILWQQSSCFKSHPLLPTAHANRTWQTVAGALTDSQACRDCLPRFVRDQTPAKHRPES